MFYRLDRETSKEAAQLIRDLTKDLAQPEAAVVTSQAAQRANRLGAILPAAAGRVGGIVRDLRGCVMDGYVYEASQLVDILALTVRSSFQGSSEMTGEVLELEVTQVPEGESNEAAGSSPRPDLATRLGLSSAREAIEAWRGDHRKSLDARNRKPPVYTDFGGGVAVGMDVPDYD